MRNSVQLILLPVLLCAGAAGLFFGILHTPPAWTLDVGSPGDTRYLSGFHRDEWDDETTYRWSKSTAAMYFYGTGAGPAKLVMQVHSDMADETSNHRVTMTYGGRKFAAFRFATGWRTYQVLLPTAHTVPPTAFEPVPLELHPRGYRRTSPDGRDLGMPIDRLHIEPLSSDTSASPAPWLALRRTLVLLWGLVVLGGVFWHLNDVLEPHRSVVAAVRHCCILVGGVALILAVWAWRSPVTLAWAWSESLAVLAWATGALLLATAVRLAMARRIGGSSRITHPSFSFPRPSWLSSLASAGGVILVLVLLVAHLLVFLPLLLPLPLPGSLLVDVQGMGAWVMMGMPGALLLLWLCESSEQPITTGEKVFVGLCGGLVFPALVVLLVQALPGPPPWWLLLLVCDGASVAALLLRRTRPGKQQQGVGSRANTPASPALASAIALLIVLVGAFFRCAALGEAEFQGDEVHIMHMAAHLLHGEDDILLMHRKGPMEILFAAAPMILTQHTTEWVARVPFALAGLGGLAGLYLLARRMFSSIPVGLLATLIIALDGLMIAFSRIVQYQNIVFLTTCAALWFCWRVYEGGSRRFLALAALFAAVGLLAHYDGVFGLPAMAWLVGAAGRKRGWSLTQWVHALRMPLLVGGGLLASFYLPFVLHEHFQLTMEYLVSKRIGEREVTGIGVNNLLTYYPLITFYNTTFQIVLLALLLAAAVALLLVAWGRPRLAGWGLAGVLLAGCAVMVWAPQWFEVRSTLNWAIVVFGLPLAGLALSPAVPVPLRASVLWFGVPFVAESFVIAQPNTHFYTMHPGAAMLIGVGVAQAVQWLRQHRARWVLAPLVVWASSVLLLTVPYMYLLFVRQFPEYQRSFPQARPSIYLASYGDRRPSGGYFGFPHQDGWKVIGELYRQGVLQGTYLSNQKELVTTWYVRGATPVDAHEDPMYYFAVRAKGYLFIPDDYHPLGSVLVDGNRMLDIYSREPVSHSPQEFHLHTYEASFDRQPVPDIPIQPELFDVDPRDVEDLVGGGGAAKPHHPSPNTFQLRACAMGLYTVPMRLRRRPDLWLWGVWLFRLRRNNHTPHQNGECEGTWFPHTPTGEPHKDLLSVFQRINHNLTIIPFAAALGIDSVMVA